MAIERSDIDDGTAPHCLAALAGQLRDGPLRELAQLQREVARLAAHTGTSRAKRLQDLERLVRLSMSAMRQFHAFTRDLRVALHDLTGAGVDPH